LVTEAFNLLWGHRAVILPGNKRNIARGISLNTKTVVARHATKSFLHLAHLALVFFPQLALLFFKHLLAKRFREGLTQVRHEAFHILPQALPLSRPQRQGLWLIGCTEIVDIHPVARSRQGSGSLSQ